MHGGFSRRSDLLTRGTDMIPRRTTAQAVEPTDYTLVPEPRPWGLNRELGASIAEPDN